MILASIFLIYTRVDMLPKLEYNTVGCYQSILSIRGTEGFEV